MQESNYDYYDYNDEGDLDRAVDAIIDFALREFEKWRDSMPSGLQPLICEEFQVWDHVFGGGDELYDENIPTLIEEIAKVSTEVESDPRNS